MPKHVPLSLLALLATLAPSAARAGDEPAVQGEESALPYLQALHAKVHRLWADNFLAMATAQLPKEHPVNLLSRVAELELALAINGDVVEVKVSKPSGSTEFDAAAVDVVKTSTPLAEASETTLSDDGKVHVKWLFARRSALLWAVAGPPRACRAGRRANAGRPGPHRRSYHTPAGQR